MTANLDPAWLLSQRPYGNSGRLLECFSLSHGRFSAVARGVYRKTHGGQPAQLMQVFYPLLLAVSGRSDLKHITRVEAAGVALRPEGHATVCGLYVNELLMRVLPRFEPQPQLFALYGDTVEKLTQGALEPSLRRFEVALLETLGYSINWQSDSEGDAVMQDAFYEYRSDQGFFPVVSGAPGSVVQGKLLLKVAQWLADSSLPVTPGILHCLKLTTRQALRPLLGDRPLQSRELAKALRWNPSA